MKAIFSQDYKSILKTLKNERVALGLTQAELSAKIGYSQSYISKVEQGQLRLDVIQLKEIAKALKVDIRKILD